MSENQIVYIIGFMGSGKSTAGKKLASLLDWKFIDLDKHIEEITGKSISEIFTGNGEDFFRETESRLLRNLKTHTHTIIATGGGTPCYSDNMEFMLNSGLTIYLKMTPGQLKSRLSGAKDERPLIKDIRPEDLQKYIEKKLDDRVKCYERSEKIVDGMNLDINKVFNYIKSRLND